MKKSSKIIVAVLLIAAAVFLILQQAGISVTGFFVGAPKNYDDFAKCLTANGAKFYGTFWCPHCIKQKQAFGDSLKYVTYTECSTPDGKNQTQACIDAKIEVYPTWVFKDGTRKSGELSFEELAQLANCPLPK